MNPVAGSSGGIPMIGQVSPVTATRTGSNITRQSGFRQLMESSHKSGMCDAAKVQFSPQPEPIIKKQVLSMLASLNVKNQEINLALHNLVTGRSISEGEMLALQGMMLNFSREVTAVSRIIESMVSSIKTTIQTQV